MGGGKKRRQRGPRQLSPTVRLDRRTLWTLNAVPGTDVYGESLRRFSGHEHRRWDPNRSKLGAGMLRTRGAPERLLPTPGETVLYLGAGHGTSVSHLYDHLCGEANRLKGRLVCVDLAPRCLRDLTFMAAKRPGLVPVLGDARQLAAWGVLLPKQVPWLFQDVAQAGQVDIFLAACKRFSLHLAAWACSRSKPPVSAGRERAKLRCSTTSLTRWNRRVTCWMKSSS